MAQCRLGLHVIQLSYSRIQFTPGDGNMENENRSLDLGDLLLANIFRLVRQSDYPVCAKAKSLVRAGKIGEMYLGVLADDAGDNALTCQESNAPKG